MTRFYRRSNGALNVLMVSWLLIGCLFIGCMAVSHLELAIDCSDRNDYEASIYHSTLAIQENPTLVLPVSLRAISYLAINKYNLALIDFKKNIELDPKSPFGYYGLASCYFSIGNIGHGYSAYMQALNVDKDYKIIKGLAEQTSVKMAGTNSQIPFEYIDGQILIKAKVIFGVKSENVTMLIDTGSPSLISSDFAGKLNMESKSVCAYITLAGVRNQAPVYNVDQIALHGVSFTGVYMIGVSLANSNIQGVIGSDLLSHCIIEIDYLNRMLTIYEQPHMLPQRTAGCQLQFEKRELDHAWAIPIKYGDKEEKVMVDTGAYSGISLTEESNITEKVDKEIAIKEMDISGYPIQKSIIEVPRVSIGNYSQINVIISVGGAAPAIGNAFLQDFVVRLNYPANLLTLFPLNSPFLSNQIWGYQTCGDINFNRCKYDLAIEDYSKALDLNTLNCKLLNSRGMAYYKNKQRERALKDYNAVLALDPSNAEAYYFRALAYEENGELDLAMHDYTATISIASKWRVEALYNRGIIYFDSELIELALEDFDRVLESDQGIAEAYIMRGQCYFIEEKYEEAIIDYSKYIQLSVANTSAYYCRALAYYEERRFDDALTDLMIAIKNDGNNADAYYACGRTFAAKEDHINAIKYYSKALDINPNLDEQYYYIALSYEEIGEKDKAIVYYKAFIEKASDGEDELVKEAKERIVDSH